MTVELRVPRAVDSSSPRSQKPAIVPHPEPVHTLVLCPSIYAEFSQEVSSVRFPIKSRRVIATCPYVSSFTRIILAEGAPHCSALDASIPGPGLSLLQLPMTWLCTLECVLMQDRRTDGRVLAKALCRSSIRGRSNICRSRYYPELV